MTPERAQVTADQLVDVVTARSRDLAAVQLGQGGTPALSVAELEIFDLGVGIAVLQTLLILQDAGLMPS